MRTLEILTNLNVNLSNTVKGGTIQETNLNDCINGDTGGGINESNYLLSCVQVCTESDFRNGICWNSIDHCPPTYAYGCTND